jgi:glycosyltransferase involved in cell wall biosynthesis
MSQAREWSMLVPATAGVSVPANISSFHDWKRATGRPTFTLVSARVSDQITLRRGRVPSVERQASRPETSETPGPAHGRVDVVIPVYNEERALPASIARLHTFLTTHLPHDWRIVIAVNASTDGTLDLARSLSRTLSNIEVAHLDQKGRGRALRTVWLASDADVVAYMDVDLSTDLSAFPPLVSAIVDEGYDIATGRRLGPGAHVVGRKRPREITSRGYNLLIRAGFRPRFTDAQCGFKALSRRAAQSLLPLVEDNTWFFDTELLLLADKHGYRIKQIPLHWTDDPDSRVNVTHTAMEDLRGLWRLKRAGY